jgi:polar amino acid transport system substrate-binding protein
MPKQSLPAWVAAMAAVLFCASPALGEELRIIGAATTFYCYPSAAGNASTSGMACDLVSEMARRVGHSGVITLYPLARALAVTAGSKATLLAPVARIAARENHFSWQVQIFEDDVVVVAPATSAVDISSLDALRKLTVGVVRDGVSALLCEQFEVRGVSPVANDDTNARKLQAGRIDAWLSTWNGIRAAQREIGSSAATLRRGVVLSRVQAYLASSPDVAPDQLANWRSAMANMVKDGTYERILKKYGFELPQ